MGDPTESQPKRRLAHQLLGLLDRRERHRATLLLSAMIVQATAELVGVASIAPFMGVVADVSLIHRKAVLARLYAWGGFATDSGFLTALGFAAIAALVLSNSVSALVNWVTYHFVRATNDRLSISLFRGYLAQPYSFFVQRNTASLNKNILAEVQTAVDGVLLPALNAIARSLVIIAIIGLLVMLDPVLALMVVLVLGGAYGAVYLTVRRKQARLGRIRADANEERYQITGEAFGGIKDVKVLQREAAFVARYGPPLQRSSQARASNRAIAVLPRYLLETVAMGSVMLIVLYHLRVGHGVAQILPTLSLYAFAGLRLMPALQQVFASFTEIRFNRAVIDDLTTDLDRFVHAELHGAPAPPLPLQRAIHFDDVHFRYTGASDCALRGATLSIPRNQTIGLVGASGSGKTTLVDLLLGLYEPAQGTIRIDGVELDKTKIPAWQRGVGYVPQHIFLCDDSIANNIAFGLPSHEVDTERVAQVAQIAQLHDFINTLPDGYNTVVGERGVRLSGGQRQRIGIARALYHDPPVLVMDEATSALDGATEDAIMEAIRALAGRKTIVLIAHRLGTVKECDRIYLFAGGRVADQGSYDELVAKSVAFRAMAKLTEPMEVTT